MKGGYHNLWSGLIRFLRKTAFFATCIHITWSVFITSFSIFLYYDHLITPMPVGIVVAGYIVLIFAGLVIWFYLLRNRQQFSALAAYQIYYYYAPIVISLIKIVAFDSLYSFNGGFFPGLYALGLYIYYIFIIIVFFIGAALSYGIEEVKKYAYRRELSKNDEYRTSVLTELIASERYKNAGLEISEENVSVSSELYCVNEEENCTVNAWVVVVFDKNWQVSDIHCQKEELVQYVPH